VSGVVCVKRQRLEVHCHYCYLYALIIIIIIVVVVVIIIIIISAPERTKPAGKNIKFSLVRLGWIKWLLLTVKSARE